MAKPTIVILHGIWHSPVTFLKFTNALQQEGYEVHIPFFPSCIGARPPIASLPQDTALVRRLVEQLADVGRNIILVMHSYGGVVGCNAIEGLDIKSRKSAGKPGGVVHLVGVAAHIHPKGFSVLDIVRDMGNEDRIPVAIDIAEDGTCFTGNAKMLLFGGIPDDEAAELEKTLSRANINCMEDKVQFEGWRHVPLTYVYTTEDMTLRPNYQQRILEKMEKAGIKAEVVELATGHSAYITKTAELVKVVDDVAKRYTLSRQRKL